MRKACWTACAYVTKKHLEPQQGPVHPHQNCMRGIQPMVAQHPVSLTLIPHQCLPQHKQCNHSFSYTHTVIDQHTLSTP